MTLIMLRSKIIDVTDPEAPALEGSYDTLGTSMEVTVVGNYAYVADGYNGLVIVDVTNPATSTLKGSSIPPGLQVEWR